MAEADYNVADRRNDDGTDVKDAPVTAAGKVAETVQDTPDADAAAAAEAAGVRYAAFVGYAAALDSLAAREDIEGLASRRAREAGDAFADADYMRGEASDTPPTPGSVNGVAPQP